MFRWKNAVSVLFATVLVVGITPARGEDNAVIKGKVIFKGDVANYKRTKINTAKDPNCKKAKPKGIGSYKVMLNKKTDPMTLRNVMVYIKDGLGDRTFKAPAEAVTLTQLGCEYKPHVLGLMEGQPLKVVNGDATNHNIHFLPKANDALNFSQPKKGMERELNLVAEAAFKVKCDVHPWMGCYIQVFNHPFFAVTGKDGTFELTGLPPGKYTVEAWHESFGTQELVVEVASGETKEADFTYEPSE